MGTRARRSATIGAVIFASTVLGMSQAVAASDPSAGTETVAADKKQATSTPVPNSVGDDLIYDFVGPNVADGGAPQRTGGRGFSAGHFQLTVGGQFGP